MTELSTWRWKRADDIVGRLDLVHARFFSKPTRYPYLYENLYIKVNTYTQIRLVLYVFGFWYELGNPNQEFRSLTFCKSFSRATHTRVKTSRTSFALIFTLRKLRVLQGTKPKYTLRWIRNTYYNFFEESRNIKSTNVVSKAWIYLSWKKLYNSFGKRSVQIFGRGIINFNFFVIFKYVSECFFGKPKVRLKNPAIKDWISMLWK